MNNLYGFYVHIPFCRRACNYCNFHFSVNLSTKDRLVGSIIKEIKAKEGQGVNISSIYFGGGTPSLLQTSSIESILKAIFETHVVNHDAEVTIECNPEDLDIQKLQEYKSLGFNRLSYGVQTFDNDILKYINRGHTGETAVRSILDAKNVGFNNISVDLIYAIPTSQKGRIAKDLSVLGDLDPSHVSAYCLTIEKKTVFDYWKNSNKLIELPDDKIFDEYIKVVEFLSSRGYVHYEVSSYSLPGYESMHNRNYWNQKFFYIGVGPSAHSYYGDTRKFNVSNNNLYIKGWESGEVMEEVEYLTTENKINEYIMTSMRTNEGLNLSILQERYNYEISDEAIWDYLHALKNEKIIEIHNRVLIPTDRGMFLADGISSKLFV